MEKLVDSFELLSNGPAPKRQIGDVRLLLGCQGRCGESSCSLRPSSFHSFRVWLLLRALL
jgi:hypothetical protein